MKWERGRVGEREEERERGRCERREGGSVRVHPGWMAGGLSEIMHRLINCSISRLIFKKKTLLD